MNMTTERSTYTYEGGEQETVTLRRGTGTPHGYALLTIKYSDGEFADCYVNTAWLRDRLNDLGEPCPVPAAPRTLTPDAITDEMVERALASFEKDRPGIHHFPWMIRNALTAALTEPPARPEGAEEVEKILGSWHLSDALGRHFTTDALDSLADHIAKEMNR